MISKDRYDWEGDADSRDKFDLSRLSTSERLLLWRRRQDSPSAVYGQGARRLPRYMTQAEAALRLPLTATQYAALEGGRKACLTADALEDLMRKPEMRRALSNAIVPTVADLCAFARRRSGIPLDRLTVELGCSRPHYLKLERAGDAAVVAYWKVAGYVFP